MREGDARNVRDEALGTLQATDLGLSGFESEFGFPETGVECRHGPPEVVAPSVL